MRMGIRADLPEGGEIRFPGGNGNQVSWLRLIDTGDRRLRAFRGFTSSLPYSPVSLSRASICSSLCGPLLQRLEAAQEHRFR